MIGGWKPSDAEQRLIKEGHEAPAVKAMIDVVASMLAARDKQELDAADQHLKDIAAKQGVNVEDLVTTDETFKLVMSAATTNSDHSPAERIRQLLPQLKWNNSQTVQETLDQMNNPTYSSSAATEVREKFRSELENKSYEKLLDMGYSPARARELSESVAAQLMKKLVITHNPDRIVGGQSDKMDTFGDSRTNSSIGNANQRASKALHEWLEEQAKKNPDAIVRIDFVEPDDKDTPSDEAPND